MKESDNECPICFLNYSEVNVTKCCQAVLCTECYLQVHPQREKSVCPFCNNPKLSVSVKHGLTETELQQRTAEEHRILAQNDPEQAPETQQPVKDTQSLQTEETALDASSSTEGPYFTSAMTSSQSSSFGSSLEQNHRFLLMKARSESVSSEGRETPPLEALALSAEERRELEAEMQAQNKHPLAQRLRMEEEERWLQNELEHHRNNSNNSTDSRVVRLGSRPPRRDWNSILNALEQDRNHHTSDDVALLEAAMMLSHMEHGRPRVARVSDLFMAGLSEEEQLAMAIAASLQVGDNDSNNEQQGDDSHAQENQAETVDADNSQH